MCLVSLITKKCVVLDKPLQILEAAYSALSNTILTYLLDETEADRLSGARERKRSAASQPQSALTQAM